MLGLELFEKAGSLVFVVTFILGFRFLPLCFFALFAFFWVRYKIDMIQVSRQGTQKYAENEKKTSLETSDLGYNVPYVFALSFVNLLACI